MIMRVILSELLKLDPVTIYMSLTSGVPTRRRILDQAIGANAGFQVITIGSTFRDSMVLVGKLL